MELEDHKHIREKMCAVCFKYQEQYLRSPIKQKKSSQDQIGDETVNSKLEPILLFFR